MGLLNVLECSARTGVRKVVFASSGGTIYEEPRKVPVKETAAAGSHPLSPYGVSKKVALDYLGFYQRYRGLDFSALALANVYGPRQDPIGEAGVVAIFTSKMLAGETPTIFGDGNQTRDYVFVDDVVHAFALRWSVARGALDIALASEVLGWRPWTHLEDGRGEPWPTRREFSRSTCAGRGQAS